MKESVDLAVYAIMPDTEMVLTGRLLARRLDRPGNCEGFFRYEQSYLEHPLAYPLDPVHLPLQAGTFDANNREGGVHYVFEDSLPDGWGRTLLAKNGDLDKNRYTSAHLLAALKGGGLGRLLYQPRNSRTPVHCSETSIDFSQIALALAEAEKHESNLDTATNELKHLLACGSSAGGARPKVLTHKDDRRWIAKFSSIRDVHPTLFVSLEEAGLHLSRLAGLNVPDTRRVSINGRELLLVERFDIAAAGGRNAIVSMKTLLGQEDPYVVSYSDMADVIRRFSTQPEKDIELIFRQMTVNIHLQNTDDHLQNFAFLHKGDGWRLSPTYDIVPSIYQIENILRINGKHGDINREDVIAEGKRFGLSSQKSRKVLDEVCELLSPWNDIFQMCGVPQEHTQQLRKNIGAKRRNLLA